MTVGPTNPPTLPTELMSAIPPAPAVPERNMVGRLQNGPSVLQMPAAATHSARNAGSGCLCTRAPTVRPAAAAKAGNATWPRRPRAVRMAGDEHHADRGREIRKRGHEGGGRAAQAGEALDDLRQPERHPVEADDDREIEETEAPHAPVRQRLPQREPLGALERLPLRCERPFEPLPLGHA